MDEPDSPTLRDILIRVDEVHRDVKIVGIGLFLVFVFLLFRLAA